MINFNIDLKENVVCGGVGEGSRLLRTPIPFPQNNPAIFNDLNILRLQNSFPKYSAVSGSYVFSRRNSFFSFTSFLLS